MLYALRLQDNTHVLMLFMNSVMLIFITLVGVKIPRSLISFTTY